MVKSEKPSLIDSVELGEATVNFIDYHNEGKGPRAVTLNAKYALVISASGQRLGAGTRFSWSEEVQEKLRVLLEAMERDICTDVFGEAPTTAGARTENDHHSDGVPGL